MTPEAAVVLTLVFIVPYLISMVMSVVLVALGVVWAPFAAVIIRNSSIRAQVNIDRPRLTGAVYSALMLIPWILLAVALSRQRLPKTLMVFSYGLLLLAWLYGPIVFWGQHAVGVGFLMGGGDAGQYVNPDLRILGYTVWSAMLLAWTACGLVFLKARARGQFATAHDLLKARAYLPFVFSWLSAAVSVLYILSFD